MIQKASLKALFGDTPGRNKKKNNLPEVKAFSWISCGSDFPYNLWFLVFDNLKASKVRDLPCDFG